VSYKELSKALLGRIRILLYANSNVINEGGLKKIHEARTGRILNRYMNRNRDVNKVT
jgi:hypothetical protein